MVYKHETASNFKKPILDFAVRNKSIFRNFLNSYEGDFLRKQLMANSA